MSEHFADRLCDAIRTKATPAVVGLDPVLERLPAPLQPTDNTLETAVAGVERFGRGVIDAVADLVPAIKINSAFFEALYAIGVAAYSRLIVHAHARGLLVIGDVKRGDIGSTARLYARGHLGQPPFSDVDPAGVPDAVTLAGYLGENAVRPFVEVAAETGRGVYILVRPSDPGADRVHEFAGDRPFYDFMGNLVDEWGRGAGLVGTCGLSCVGAVVAPKDAGTTSALRKAMPHTPFLVPGYGAQGAGAEACRPCFREDGTGAIVNASRSVIYAFEKSGNAEPWESAVRAAARRFAEDLKPLGPSRW